MNRRLSVPPSLRKWALLFAPWAIVLLYIGIATYKIKYPGTQYDEALYLNAALGGVDTTTFVTSTFHRIPILLMPYIGALKAYVFFPIFALFGVSAVSMRLPIIILTGLGLYVLYQFVRAEAGKWLALCVLLLTALDASFIMFTRLDNGPVVLDFLLKVVGLLALLRFVQGRRLWWLAGFWVCMLLGVFNKLNFVWEVNAIAAAFGLAYGLPLWRKLRPAGRWQTLLISAAGYALCVGYYLYINTTYHLASSFGFVGWRTIYNNLVALVDGSWFYNYALSPAKIGTDHVFWLMLAVIGAGLIACLVQCIRKWQALDQRLVRFFIFIAAALLLLLAQIAMTLKATAGWHYFSVYPFFGIVFVGGVYFVVHTLWPKRRQLVRIGVAVAVALCCVYQLNIYRQYVATYGKPSAKIIWSTAIYSLVDDMRVHNGPVVSLDWGMQTQLIGFDPVSGKYTEVFGPINLDDAAQTADYFQQYIINKPGAYYVAHPAGQAILPDTATRFFVLARQHGYQPVPVKTIYDGTQPVFEIYRLSPPQP